MHKAGHHVFRNADAGIAADDDAGMLVHAAAIIADIAIYLDHYRNVQAYRNGVEAAAIENFPVRLASAGFQVVQRLVELPDRGVGQIEGADVFEARVHAA